MDQNLKSGESFPTCKFIMCQIYKNFKLSFIRHEKFIMPNLNRTLQNLELTAPNKYL